jgi:hypothetical protein
VILRILTAAICFAALAAMQETPPATGGGEIVHLAKTLGISVEEAESRIRLADRLGILQLRVRSDPDFAGAYLEHEPKVQAVVMFKGDAAAKLALYVSDDAFTPRSTVYSLGDLAAAANESRRAFKAANLAIIRIETDIEANRVVVEVADDAPARTAIAAGKLRLPPSVVIEVTQGEIALEPQTAGVVTHFPQAREPATKEMRALMTGTLFERDGCLRIGSQSGESLLVIWPSSALLGEDKSRIVVTGEFGGRLVAGTEVSIGGGSVTALQPGSLLEPIVERCAGPYWIASRH